MRLVSFIAVAIAICAQVIAEDVDEKDVIVLTKDNFDSTTKAADIMLVEFYAPWCGHCKKLTPEYAKAATQLKANEPVVLLGKVDATIESDLAQRYGVSGYPTLKVFRNGQPSDYSGPREADGIVSYMQKQTGPSAKPIDTNEAFDAFIKNADISVIGFFPSKSGAAYNNFVATANSLRDSFRFGLVSDKSVAEHAGYTGEAIVVFRPFDEPKNVYTGANTVKALTDFVYAKSIATVGQYTRDNSVRYKRRNLPIVKVYVDVNFETNAKQAGYYINRVKKVVNMNKAAEGKLLFAVAAKKDFQDEIKNLGLEGKDVVMGIDHSELRYRTTESFSVESLDSFVKDYLAGSLKPYIKSEPVPAAAKPGEVTVVVGETFNDIVMDPTKDVLIEMYAPWCGHCKKLEPIYDSLAKKLKDEPNVVIAKMDATANDSPQPKYQAKGYPTILYAPANNKQNPIKFEGAREVKAMYDWLKEKKTVEWESLNKKKASKKDKQKDEL